MDVLVYPACLLGGLLIFQAAAALLGPQGLELSLMLTSFAVLGVVLLLEKRRPFNAEWTENRGDLKTDALFTFLLLPATFTLAQATWKAVVPAAPMKFFLATSPAWVQVVAGLFLAEFFYYWFHRWSHSLPIFWRFHKFHHESSRVYSVNSGRFHLVDGYLSSLIYLFPLVMVGGSEWVATNIFVLGVITGYLEHVNIRFRAGALNYVFNTAELHRWHHAVPESLEPANFGKVLSVYDWIFGTAKMPAGVPRVGLGEKETSDEKALAVES